MTGAGFYNAGTSASVTATAGVGFTFTGWTPALTPNTASSSVTMNAPTTVTANFNAPAPLTVVSFNVLWGSESYNVIGTTRNRLPWQITGIQVVFSKAVAAGNINSLSGTGVTTTAFSGLGTTTLTWTISPHRARQSASGSRGVGRQCDRRCAR